MKVKVKYRIKIKSINKNIKIKKSKIKIIKKCNTGKYRQELKTNRMKIDFYFVITIIYLKKA